MKVILCKNMQKAVLKTGVHSNTHYNIMKKINSSFRDRVFLIGAVCLVIIFLLDFFRINLTNNVTVIVVIGSVMVIIMYIQNTVKKI